MYVLFCLLPFFLSRFGPPFSANGCRTETTKQKAIADGFPQLLSYLRSYPASGYQKGNKAAASKVPSPRSHR
jgi:hypothetical protein